MILLIQPPLTQLNTPYPAITHLTAYLKSCDLEVQQADLGIELIDRLFTRDAIEKIFFEAESKCGIDFHDDNRHKGKSSRNIRSILANKHFYINKVESVIAFLRGNKQSLATMFACRDFWEEMPRMESEEELEFDYGLAGNYDRAKYLCSLFIKNITDIINIIDPNFELIRYAEHLCTYIYDFNIIESELHKTRSIVTDMTLDLLEEKIRQYSPDFVGFSVPFPGNLLQCIFCAEHIKKHHPGIKTVMGGGYVNTELRKLSQPDIFKYIDYITYDDGELPLLNIITGNKPVRTACLEADKVVFHNMDSRENVPFAELPAPTTMGLPMDKYINFTDSTNPMHRLWSDGKWNKMMLAHGCYWAKCAFCDTSLDYICRFERCDISIIVDRMEAMMHETGENGFHFVDEAAPPALLKQLSEEIIKRKLVVSYWTNIRFDRSFTPELCRLLAKSGCIAVSGGLEVASPRVLKLINKGVTIESATECIRNLSNSGIMVHTYLMYGFPSQTESELFDSLGRVRDLFAEGLIQSAFWHRYAMTCHSSSGKNPESVGAKAIKQEDNPFANNEIPFIDPLNINWEKWNDGLNIATYNYMRGTGFDVPLKQWFHFFKISKPNPASPDNHQKSKKDKTKKNHR